ncbi:hypothetical protein [Paraburkholderia madseniana]|uniref:hypothetical protein n=1 Tax=Paraburkholderia madseniana TaxID=2599607 RepID=UPI001F35FB9F|nr:hypothetical protein [Paraburkholderia madseniana]
MSQLTRAPVAETIINPRGVAVMARLSHRDPITLIPEERHVAAMRDAMINDSGRPDAPAHPAFVALAYPYMSATRSDARN